MAVNLEAKENKTPQKNIFQEMRENLTQNFSKITTLVNQRKIDLDKKVDELEIEYNNKNKQLEKDKQTLVTLRQHTEQQLNQDTLLDAHEDITREISKKIEKLETELKSRLESTLTLNWNYQALSNMINQIDVELKPKQNNDIQVVLGPAPSLFPTQPSILGPPPEVVPRPGQTRNQFGTPYPEQFIPPGQSPFGFNTSQSKRWQKP